MRKNTDQKKLLIWTLSTQCSVIPSLVQVKVDLLFKINSGGPITLSLLPRKFEVLSVKVTQGASCGHFICNHGQTLDFM